MDKVDIKGFFLLGISVRTTNANGQSAKDIGELWGRFMENDIMQQITNRINDEVYCVYTDYESDQGGFYTTVLGCRVKNLDNIPVGLIGRIVTPGGYLKYTAKGRLPDCVAETWQHIWNSTIDRKYTADFDLYGAKAQDPEDAEVEVYVGVK
ncbi:GyrI-like domain-containing protein [Mucilaginibacter sabulilitoris]|uniref:GyrI-like domain-containing protein n=1 Tax=Mucilaginibacter sabulilitoris TaxID=1173583 RepID=A0ABZ0TTW4_9SPHI|nr:GyrI-like domain-containing protein [Mucilaginibacter sabulilitoris]WPU96555.1 GyrI-like domain-containing protein [Mucilaginibacter sabulilitoris]